MRQVIIHVVANDRWQSRVVTNFKNVVFGVTVAMHGNAEVNLIVCLVNLDIVTCSEGDMVIMVFVGVTENGHVREA